MRKKVQWLLVLILALSLLASCAQPEGEKLLRDNCTNCHKKSEVVAEGRTREDWATVIRQMLVWGAELSEEEQAILADYLAENYGP